MATMDHKFNWITRMEAWKAWTCDDELCSHPRGGPSHSGGFGYRVMMAAHERHWKGPSRDGFRLTLRQPVNMI